MLQNFAPGVYYPGNSFLHRLQARTKLLALVFLVVGTTLAGHFYWHFLPYMVGLLLVVSAVFLSRVAWHDLFRRIWFLLLLVVIGSLFTFFVPVGTGDKSRVIYTFPVLLFTPKLFAVLFLVLGSLIGIYLLFARLPLPGRRSLAYQQGLRTARLLFFLLFIPLAFAFLYAYLNQPGLAQPGLAYLLTADGIWYASIFLLLFLIIYPSSLLLTMTTSPVALIEGLSILLKPLRWLRLPVDDFALMTLLALRFIPTLIEEVEHMINAQEARGASLRSGPWRDRLLSLPALIVPLFRNTLRRASELATALDARGYQTEGQPTYLYEKPFSFGDYLVLLVVPICLILAFLI